MLFVFGFDSSGLEVVHVRLLRVDRVAARLLHLDIFSRLFLHVGQILTATAYKGSLGPSGRMRYRQEDNKKEYLQ